MDIDITKGITSLTGTALKQGMGIWFVVNGGSMIPFLSSGERVYVEQCDLFDLALGDVVLFPLDNTYFTHRIIFWGRDDVRTKGDNLPYPDPPMRKENIAGKVIKVDKGTVVWDMRDAKWKKLNHLFGWLNYYAVIIASTKTFTEAYPSDALLRNLLRVNRSIVILLERILLRGRY